MSDETTPAHDAIDPNLPEVVQHYLRKGYKLEDITLHADGRWTHEGLDFENERVIKLFSRSVGRTEGGTWVLEIPPFTYPIHVEDAGYFVEAIDLDQSPPHLRLSDESSEPLDAATLRYEPGGKLYCTIKHGDFKARFKRAPYYKLAERVVERDGEMTLTLEGHTIALGDVDQESV